MIEVNKIYHGDCLEAMKDIPDGSIDMVLADPPYGTTACKWDSVINFGDMWTHLKRIVQDNSAIVLTASQPFTSALIASNFDMFRYCWVWDKKFAGNFVLAKKQPLKIHEDIVVFSIKGHRYYPNTIKRREKIKVGKNVSRSGSANLQTAKPEFDNKVYDIKQPESIVEFSNRSDGQIRKHPTQKPVNLFEYLITTYTKKGDTVLDFTGGSGTTAVACRNTHRNFIVIEKEQKYVEIANKRLLNAEPQLF